MSKPIRGQSIDSSTSAGAGETVRLKGHNSIGIFVTARNLDSYNDTLDLRVEVSTGDVNEWAIIEGFQQGNKVDKLVLDIDSFEDVDGDGTFTAFRYAHGVPAEKARARIANLNDAAGSDLEVDAYIMATGWTGPGFRYHP